ncbi:DUF4139 domain-containing protein [Aggregicoccus sp. 17bor-14]|uniref:DUF4139 domain-containing protein n=1 Tax=Myxococcaceae TaxID=31 RepID=UPI00129CB1ED|nr:MULTISPECIES: DUF4139 domain-containing protein [Myxococcaceae]MBF5042214.1 DUF4139 domain-containing protein [Simulacricoccus sp. 17bor-14]MRI87990.1 DUF4139 domain-containing protein [Aggregicoccus sp. 17bor-14]
MNRHLNSLAALLLLSGCAHHAAVSSEQGLPLRRVVIYRNGVGYFERAGHVESERVAFQVKREHVGDFLATLAVMEEGRSAVRSAAFPTAAQGERRTVELALDGRAHQLAVGYVVEQPIWRPTYRVVVGKSGLELQAWGIVQNLSGEDWRDVQLSLVAGAPIAYRATLEAPVTPGRPLLEDSGEVFAGVPRGESVLAQAPGTLVVPGEAPTVDVGSTSTGVNVGKDFVRNIAVVRPTGKAGAGRSFEALAAVARASAAGGTTRYELPHPVSIPDASASMVLLASRTVPGEAVLLFSPDPGAPDSARHPFRVARFTNDSAGLLERGPIAVFEEGAFLGQGVLESLPAGAQATVPFSLERGVAVESRSESVQEGARLALVEAGVLTLERDTVLRTTYRVQNGEAKPARVLLRHARSAQARLAASPKGTEEQVGAGFALVPAEVAAHASAEAKVEERTSARVQADWFDPAADVAVNGYLEDPRADRTAKEALAALWKVRDAIVRERSEEAKWTEQGDTLSEEADEARESLRSLAKSRAADLKGRLQARLSDLESQHAAAADALVRAQLARHEAEVDFAERLRTLGVRAP